jgi:hypothetical protein
MGRNGQRLEYLPHPECRRLSREHVDATKSAGWDRLIEQRTFFVAGQDGRPGWGDRTSVALRMNGRGVSRRVTADWRLGTLISRGILVRNEVARWAMQLPTPALLESTTPGRFRCVRDGEHVSRAREAVPAAIRLQVHRAVSTLTAIVDAICNRRVCSSAQLRARFDQMMPEAIIAR